MGDRVIRVAIMRNPAHERCRTRAAIAFHPPAHTGPLTRRALVIDAQIERRDRFERAAGLPDRHAAGHVHQADDRAGGEHRAAAIPQQIFAPRQFQFDPVVALIGKPQSQPAGVAMLEKPFGCFARIEPGRGRGHGRRNRGKDAPGASFVAACSRGFTKRPQPADQSRLAG